MTWSTGFRIRNGSSIPSYSLQVSVTKVTNPNGRDTWFDLASDFADPGTSYWSRDGWETIVVAHKQTGQRRGYHLNCQGTAVEIVFAGFTENESGTSRHPATLRQSGFWIWAANGIAADAYQMRVSKNSNPAGDDRWYPLNQHPDAGTSVSFWRMGWETVMIEEKATGKQRGWYIDAKDLVVEITFKGLDQELGLTRSPMLKD